MDLTKIDGYIKNRKNVDAFKIINNWFKLKNVAIVGKGVEKDQESIKSYVNQT